MQALAKGALSILLAVSSTAVHAFIGPVTLDPPVLAAGQEGSVKVTMGACDYFGGDSGFVIEREISGNVVSVTVGGNQIQFEDFCLFPEIDYAFTYGPLPPGQYVVRLLRKDNDPPHDVDLIGEANLVVVPAVQSIPTLGDSQAVLLGLLLACLACWRIRRGTPVDVTRDVAIVLGLLILASPNTAKAASITVASGSGTPGSAVSIPVTVTGDGQTTDVEVHLTFDDGRLSLPVTSGIIPGAGQNGATCARPTSNTIVVITPTNTNGTPLPGSATTLCNLPFTVVNPSASGLAPISNANSLCFTWTGGSAPSCTKTSGVITVTGGLLAMGAPTIPSNLVTAKSMYVMLRSDASAPTVQQLTSTDLTGSPQSDLLPELKVESALSTHPLLPVRATGAFASYLAQYPTTARAKLERYLTVIYPPEADLAKAKVALLGSKYVQAVVEGTPVTLTATQGTQAARDEIGTKSTASTTQYHLNSLNVPAAWDLAGGWSLMGMIDNGLRMDHVDLRSFTGTNSIGGTMVPGGNYLPAYSLNLGETPPTVNTNLDEMTPEPAPGQGCDISTLGGDGVEDGLITTTTGGHGTHVAGLAVANSNSQSGMKGVCKHCGLAMFKNSRTICVPQQGDYYILPAVRESVLNVTGATESSITLLSQVGAQVISMSLASRIQTPYVGFCGPDPYDPVGSTAHLNDPWCLALKYATENDIVLVAAAGNMRERIAFPARDYRVVAVGGTDATGAYWDESPGTPINYTTCPYGSGDPRECGSNFTDSPGERKQEVVAPAREIRSTFYPGKDWNAKINCGDSFGGGSASDGTGICTGTSMSTPQVAAMFALLRSINPLVPVGDPELPAYGLRDVVVGSTDRAKSQLGWDSKLGYGMPDAAAAARTLLGNVRGLDVRTRVTPLFSLYSTAATDYAVVATPQSAVTLIRNLAQAYTTTGAGAVEGVAVPGYTAFPHESGGLTPPPPRASAYVLTTEYAPVLPQGVSVQPLYLLDRPRNFPVGCATGQPGCNSNNRDFMLLSSASQVNTAVADGYRYLGYQGYVYAAQQTGTQTLWLKCNVSEDDCAVFPESQRAAFESRGYTAAYPSGSNMILGYAYPAVDTDNDGLPDGLEYVIGTNPNLPDSDGDGLSDSAEFPLVGVQVSDPCAGPSITCLVPANALFANSFE